MFRLCLCVLLMISVLYVFSNGLVCVFVSRMLFVISLMDVFGVRLLVKCIL